MSHKVVRNINLSRIKIPYGIEHPALHTTHKTQHFHQTSRLNIEQTNHCSITSWLSFSKHPTTFPYFSLSQTRSLHTDAATDKLLQNISGTVDAEKQPATKTFLNHKPEEKVSKNGREEKLEKLLQHLNTLHEQIEEEMLRQPYFLSRDVEKIGQMIGDMVKAHENDEKDGDVNVKEEIGNALAVLMESIDVLQELVDEEMMIPSLDVEKRLNKFKEEVLWLIDR